MTTGFSDDSHIQSTVHPLAQQIDSRDFIDGQESYRLLAEFIHENAFVQSNMIARRKLPLTCATLCGTLKQTTGEIANRVIHPTEGVTEE